MYFIGHFFQIGHEPHKRFTKWARSLGDIYSVQMGQQNWIILTSDKVVGELLQQRGGKYSTRLPSHYTFQILTRGKGYAGSPYNERYKKLTPIMHKILGQRSVRENSDLLNDEFRILMQNLCQESEKAKDEFEDLMRQHLEISKTTNRLSEFFPILKWFPNNKLQNTIIENRDSLEAFLGKLVKEVIDDNEKKPYDNEKKPCVIRGLLHKKDEGILDDLDIIYLMDRIYLVNPIYLINEIFAAGTDTVSASLTWLTATLANIPHVQSKAHQELDRVIGQSRIPEVSDEQNIPYIRAIIKESQRYCGPLYLGVPHGIEEDDEYNGYHIPANSVVILNQYGIHMDENRYENSKEFKPDRFLGFTESSATLANGKYENRDHFAFGAGRRLCTGIHMACITYGVSRLLWCFKIENASSLGNDENASSLGNDGKPIPINLNKVRFGITVWPEEYKVRFVKRHDNVEKVLSGQSQ
ncbi:cytochrome P450 [Gigaspora rosea]|uniref:Cytochrome P450 n=1 Tax=Gigaspora rosea TaxID=44941 RepID=A0A397UGB3_9GLOM|nr:cytochrome P450 [Gigaspora rosea]